MKHLGGILLVLVAYIFSLALLNRSNSMTSPNSGFWDVEVAVIYLVMSSIVIVYPARYLTKNRSFPFRCIVRGLMYFFIPLQITSFIAPQGWLSGMEPVVLICPIVGSVFSDFVIGTVLLLRGSPSRNSTGLDIEQESGAGTLRNSGRICVPW